MSLAQNPEERNIGAIKTIQLISLDALSYIPTPGKSTISYNDLVFAAGGSFEAIYHTPESGTFEDSETLTRAGSLWTKNINFSIPKIRTEVTNGLKNYEGKRNAALVTDFNGTSFLVFPLRILRKKQIPGQFSSKNAILVQMTGQSKFETPVITDLP